MSSDTAVSGVKMASCNDSCGCPSPCPGGILCRCMKVETTSGDGHAKCSCGEHCGCNPCTCAKGISSARAGRIYCNCAQNCNCPTCAS